MKKIVRTNLVLVAVCVLLLGFAEFMFRREGSDPDSIVYSGWLYAFMALLVFTVNSLTFEGGTLRKTKLSLLALSADTLVFTVTVILIGLAIYELTDGEYP